MTAWMKNFYEKIKAGEKFSESDLRVLAWEGGTAHSIGSGRFQTKMVTVLDFDGDVYLLPWLKGLTEYQENLFEDQPVKVSTEKHKEVIEYEITEYKDSNNKVIFSNRKKLN